MFPNTRKALTVYAQWGSIAPTWCQSFKRGRDMTEAKKEKTVRAASNSSLAAKLGRGRIDLPVGL